MTMITFFPPISSEQILSVRAAFPATIRPVSVEPVNETRRTPGCVVIGSPASTPVPVTILITPGGRPAASAAFTKLIVESGVSSAGLMTSVLPQINAGIIFHEGIAIGKFQGVISEQMPTGWRTHIASLSGNSEGVV